MTLIDVDEKKVRRYTTEAFEEKKQERMDSEAKQIVERVTQKLEAHQFQKDIEDLRLSVASRSDTGGNSSFITPRSTITHSPVSTPGPILPQVGSDIPDEALYGAGHPSMDEEREITGKIIFIGLFPSRLPHNVRVDMDVPSEFIKQMIHRVLHSPPILRKAALQQSLRVLLRWSLFLIAHLPKKLEGEDGLRNHKGLKQIQVFQRCSRLLLFLLTRATITQQLQSDLGISNEADFHLFLHTADACRPGFYSSILNNPKAVGKLVLDLFESF